MANYVNIFDVDSFLDPSISGILESGKHACRGSANIRNEAKKKDSIVDSLKGRDRLYFNGIEGLESDDQRRAFLGTARAIDDVLRRFNIDFDVNDVQFLVMIGMTPDDARTLCMEGLVPVESMRRIFNVYLSGDMKKKKDFPGIDEIRFIRDTVCLDKENLAYAFMWLRRVEKRRPDLFKERTFSEFEKNSEEIKHIRKNIGLVVWDEDGRTIPKKTATDILMNYSVETKEDGKSKAVYIVDNRTGEKIDARMVVEKGDEASLWYVYWMLFIHDAESDMMEELSRRIDNDVVDDVSFEVFMMNARKIAKDGKIETVRDNEETDGIGTTPGNEETPSEKEDKVDVGGKTTEDVKGPDSATPEEEEPDDAPAENGNGKSIPDDVEDEQKTTGSENQKQGNVKRTDSSDQTKKKKVDGQKKKESPSGKPKDAQENKDETETSGPAKSGKGMLSIEENVMLSDILCDVFAYDSKSAESFGYLQKKDAIDLRKSMNEISDGFDNVHRKSGLMAEGADKARSLFDIIRKEIQKDLDVENGGPLSKRIENVIDGLKRKKDKNDPPTASELKSMKLELARYFTDKIFGFNGFGDKKTERILNARHAVEDVYFMINRSRLAPDSVTVVDGSKNGSMTHKE